MIGVELEPGSLDTQAPALLGTASVVALVPATRDRAWAAAMAWRLARAIAATGRKTALVDCFVNEPLLHESVGAKNDEGIVDAFEYGASLQRIVQQQPDANLFFIAAGTFAPDPEPLTTHPRWRRLSAGFRHEEAALLLFCPDASLSGLAAQPDGMIVLAPDGMDLAIAEWPALAEALGSGRPPLLGVIAAERAAAPAPAPAPEPAPLAAPAAEAPAEPWPEPETPPAQAAPAPAPRRTRPSAPRLVLEQHSDSKAGVWWSLAAVIAIAVAGWYFRAELVALAGFGEPEAAATSSAAPGTAAPLPAAELLPFVVLVSQWASSRDAFRVADTLESRGVHTILTPLRLQSRVWYRIYAGPAPSAAAAESLLAGLRTQRLLAADGGEVLELPLSISLPGSHTPGQADAERARLETAGVPTFVLGQADGGYRLFAGAFDGTSAAVLLQSLLTPAGGSGTLVPRVGFVP